MLKSTRGKDTILVSTVSFGWQNEAGHAMAHSAVQIRCTDSVTLSLNAGRNDYKTRLMSKFTEFNNRIS